jgi:hypothetical protein
MPEHVDFGNDGACLPDLTSDLPGVWVMHQHERGSGDYYFLKDGDVWDSSDDDLPDEAIRDIMRKRMPKQGEEP